MIGHHGCESRNKGLDKRTTTEANSLFNGAFKLASDRHAIALSPAVASIEPADGSQLKPGETAHVKVTFDSEILAPAAAKDLFQIDDNCGTSKNESFSSDGTTLTFDYVVPSQPKGQTSILTILADKAVGGSGFPNKLDGNNDPPGTDGQARNGDNYTAKYTCAAGINLFVSGQVAGQQVDGQIGSGAQIMCLPPTSEGSPAIVHWSGVPDKTHNSVSGEFDLKYGTWSPSNAQGASSFQVNNPSLQRVGWTGGTITVSATGGTVDADFTDGPGSVHVRGTWTCPG